MISDETRQIVQEYAQRLFDEVWVDYDFLKDKKMKPLDETFDQFNTTIKPKYISEVIIRAKIRKVNDKKMKPLDEDQEKELIAIVEKRDQPQTIIDRIMAQVTEHNMRSLSKPKILVLSTPAYKELGEYMKIHYNYCFNNITVDARGYFVVHYCLGMDVAELVKPTNEIEIHVF
jgi:hypothetical protein